MIRDFYAGLPSSPISICISKFNLHRLKLVAFALCLTVFAGWPAGGAIYTSGNLVQNGDFHDWNEESGPAHWTWTEDFYYMGYGVIFDTISQQLATVPGQAYRIEYEMAGTPFDEVVAVLNVYWNNAPIGSTTWTPNAPMPEGFHWLEGAFVLTASSSQSVIMFENGSAMPDSHIPFLTGVSVVPIPEPSSLALIGIAVGVWARSAMRKRV